MWVVGTSVGLRDIGRCDAHLLGRRGREYRAHCLPTYSRREGAVVVDAFDESVATDAAAPLECAIRLDLRHLLQRHNAYISWTLHGHEGLAGNESEKLLVVGLVPPLAHLWVPQALKALYGPV
eukprot:scaffold14290_cov125-Isochrysis_galbana.AAC.1